MLPYFRTGILALVVLASGALGYYLAASVPAPATENLFAELLTITLTLMGLAIAAFGLGAYRILQDALRKDVLELARKQSSRHAAATLATAGYAFWSIYVASKKTEVSALVSARYLTKQALDIAAKMDDTEREDGELKNEKLICYIRNNLGYYLAELKDREGKELEAGDDGEAKICVKYLQERAHRYPVELGDWQDTWAHIEKALAKTYDGED